MGGTNLKDNLKEDGLCKNVALRSENGGLYIVDDNAVYFNDGKELLEGLVSDIVTYEDGTFDGENYEVVKDSIVPKGCCSAFRVAFERDMFSCVVTIGYDGSAVLYACGEKFCCVNNILSQLMKYKVNETMLTRGMRFQMLSRFMVRSLILWMLGVTLLSH